MADGNELAAQAAQLIQAQGMPVTAGNLNRAIQMLTSGDMSSSMSADTTGNQVSSKFPTPQAKPPVPGQAQTQSVNPVTNPEIADRSFDDIIKGLVGQQVPNNQIAQMMQQNLPQVTPQAQATNPISPTSANITQSPEEAVTPMTDTSTTNPIATGGAALLKSLGILGQEDSYENFQNQQGNALGATMGLGAVPAAGAVGVAGVPMLMQALMKLFSNPMQGSSGLAPQAMRKGTERVTHRATRKEPNVAGERGGPVGYF